MMPAFNHGSYIRPMATAAQQVPAPGELVLDHVSHFVPDLAAAAGALRALGFAVTPESAQQLPEGPAGTSNVCVMLPQGYLEILAPTMDTPNAQRLRASMARYPGVHLCCFGTPDAPAEHQRLEAHGFAPQPLVSLSRKVETGDTARFSVVRPAPDRMPEGRIQFVQHFTPEVIWRDEHLRHDNAVTKLACLFVVADDPVDAAARWGHFSSLLPSPAGGYVHLAASRGHVLIGKRGQWRALLGGSPAAPGIAGYALACEDTKPLLERCRKLGLEPREIRRGLYAVLFPAALGGALVFGTQKSLGLD
jgi:hypothetical protein